MSRKIKMRKIKRPDLRGINESGVKIPFFLDDKKEKSKRINKKNLSKDFLKKWKEDIDKKGDENSHFGFDWIVSDKNEG